MDEGPDVAITELEGQGRVSLGLFVGKPERLAWRRGKSQGGGEVRERGLLLSVT